MNKLYIILVLVFSSVLLQGQSKRQFTSAGDEAFAIGNYFAALTYYNEALEFDNKDPQVLFKSAESARMFDSYKLAIQKYTYLLDTLNYNEEKLVLFYLGELNQKLGSYAKAKDYYNLYVTQYGDDTDYYTQKAKVEVLATEWATEKIGVVDSLVEINRLTTDVNTVDSDFAPTFKGENLMYSSMRFKEKNAKIKPSRQISKILIYKDGSSEVYDEKLHDSDLSFANTAIGMNGKTIYFTKCAYIFEGKLRCDLYKGEMVNDSIIGEVEILKTLNDTAHTTTHPTIGQFNNDDREVLFFASDRKEGKGKLDIWYSYLNAGIPSEPKNLKAINTVEDDITPFYHKISNTLYFSSNGKRGFGGFDIYGAIFNADSIIEQYHLDPPINSSYNDVYYVLSDDFKKGYLSSNREGSLYIDKMLESCCYDIYQLDFKELTINLKTLTFDKKTSLDLLGSTVILIDQSTGAEVGRITNDTSNLAIFPLKRGKTYFLKAEKQYYLSDSTVFNTNDIRTSQDITKKLFLQPDLITLDAFTFDLDTKEALNGATVVLEDLTDPKNPQIIKVNELGNDFKFDLQRGKTYRLRATKNGYTVETALIDTKGMTGGTIKKDLFLRKLNLMAYLNLKLYFDNDHPDPRTKTTATAKLYKTTLDAYLKKKAEFERIYLTGTTGQIRKESKEDLDLFFTKDVQGGYDTFNLFLVDLLNELKQGQRIEVNIKGYASPRSDLKYNLVLAQRRVNSLRNEMMAYNGGVFKPYFKGKQLILNQISYGEELAPGDVSDNINDRKGSVYSIKASKQRKVEIISIKAKL
jgi:outer membrane protein OmpA-like peptidoglycan-associated protein